MPNNPIPPDPTADTLSGTQVSLPATVTTVGQLPPFSSAVSLQDDGQLAPWWGYGVTVSLLQDEGLRAAPAAGPRGSACSIWRAHGGMAVRIVTGVCQRMNFVPTIPDWKSQSDNEVFFGKVVSQAHGQDMPGGDKLFTVAFQYVYVLQVIPDDGAPTPFPQTPMQTPATVLLDPSQFSKLLIAPTPLPSGFQGQRINF